MLELTFSNKPVAETILVKHMLNDMQIPQGH